MYIYIERESPLKPILHRRPGLQHFLCCTFCSRGLLEVRHRSACMLCVLGGTLVLSHPEFVCCAHILGLRPSQLPLQMLRSSLWAAAISASAQNMRSSC